MIQMIAGTIKNAVKLDMLTKNWEQKKSSNSVFDRTAINAKANKSPEQKMLEQFQIEMEQSREQSKNNGIAYKIMNGDDLTLEEEKYLAQNNPGQLGNYRRAKAERKAYEEKLQKCKTKDEVQRLKTNTVNAYLSELKSAHGEAKSSKAIEILGKLRNIQKAELHFIESGEYSKLPTEADEAKDRAEERSRENEEALEILKESADVADENAEVTETEDDIEEDTEPFRDTRDDETIIDDENKKEPKPKKKEKDPIEEIKNICRRYIPNVDGDSGTTGLVKGPKPKENKPGSTIDVTM